mgnify:CR=1 FL=1
MAIKLTRVTVSFQVTQTPVANFSFAEEDSGGLLKGIGSYPLQLGNQLSITLNDGTVLTGQQIRQVLRKLAQEARP